MNNVNTGACFCEMNENELQQIDGGSFWGSVLVGLKVAGSVAGCGLGGLVVGAGAVLGVYFACKAIFG